MFTEIKVKEYSLEFTSDGEKYVKLYVAFYRKSNNNNRKTTTVYYIKKFHESVVIKYVPKLSFPQVKYDPQNPHNVIELVEKLNTYFQKILQNENLARSSEFQEFATEIDTFPKSKDFTKKSDFWNIKSTSEDNEDDIDTIHKFLNKITPESPENAVKFPIIDKEEEEPEKKEKKKKKKGFQFFKSKQDVNVDEDDEDSPSKFLKPQSFEFVIEKEEKEEIDEEPMYLVYLHATDQNIVKVYLNHTLGYFSGETIIGKIEFNNSSEYVPEFRLVHDRLIESTKSFSFCSSSIKYSNRIIDCRKSPARFKYNIPITACYGNFHFDFTTDHDTIVRGFCGLQFEKEKTKIKNMFGLLQSKIRVPFIIYPAPIFHDSEIKDYFCLDKLYAKFRLQVKTYSNFCLGKNSKVSLLWNNYDSSYPLSIFEVSLIQKLDLHFTGKSENGLKLMDCERRLNIKERQLISFKVQQKSKMETTFFLYIPSDLVATENQKSDFSVSYKLKIQAKLGHTDQGPKIEFPIVISSPTPDSNREMLDHGEMVTIERIYKSFEISNDFE
eukprot:gene512-8025_t